MNKVQKPLIAITTCHRFKFKADAQRATWIKKVSGIDYKFFLGRGGEEPPGADEVFLDVPDDYEGLPWKVRAIMKWALEHGYDAVFKCDDDTFLFPDKLLNVLPTTPYEGRLNTSNKKLAPNGWCSGFAYWLTGDGLKIIAEAPEPTNRSEDLWVGIMLNKHNIKPTNQKGFVVLSVVSPRLWAGLREQVIATCEFPGNNMLEIHEAMHSTNAITINKYGGMDPRTGKRVARFGEVLLRRRR